MDQLRPSVEGPSVDDVSARTVPGYDGGPEVPIRVYRPAGSGPFPTVVYLHGGGFVLGNLDSHDLVCRPLCREAEAVVVAAAYRLAPEIPFPAGIEDAYAVTDWVSRNRDEVERTGRLAIAGGTLVVGVTLMARDRDGPTIDYQLLVYPSSASRRTGARWTSSRPATTSWPRTWSGSTTATSRATSTRPTTTPRRCSPATTRTCRRRRS